MPQQTEYYSLSSEPLVSHIDYSEAQTILDLTTRKQKELRRQRSPCLFKQVLLNRTLTVVCDLLDSDCSSSSSSSYSNPIALYQSSPLSAIDTNKRKLAFDDVQSNATKKSKSLMDKCYDITNDDDVLQFLRELNSVKVTARY